MHCRFVIASIKYQVLKLGFSRSSIYVSVIICDFITENNTTTSCFLATILYTPFVYDKFNEKWSKEYFKESLTRFHPGFIANQCAMEKLILLLLGLNLRKEQNSSSLDFEYSSNLLKKGIEILRGIFGEEEGNAATIHLKNMY